MAAAMEQQQEVDINVENPPPYQATNNESPPQYSPSPNAADQPPSYESIFGKVQAARAESENTFSFLKAIVVIFFGTLGCTICVGLVLAIPIAMIVIGVKYKDDCPAEDYIPIYLIVGGVVGVLKNLFDVMQRAKNRREERDEENARTNPVDSLLNCFLLAWFIAGNVWIYRTYDNWSSDPKSDDYCDPTLYWFAFWITTVSYILMGLICLGICCGGVLASFFSSS